jgi:hypothetical protein
MTGIIPPRRTAASEAVEVVAILLVAQNKRNKEAEICFTDYSQFLFVKVYSASTIGKPAPITPVDRSPAFSGFEVKNSRHG